MGDSADEVIHAMIPMERPNGTRRTESSALWLVLFLAACGFAFFKLGSEVLEGETQAFDERVLRALRRSDDPAHLVGPPWLEQAVIDLTALGGTALIGLGVVLTVAYLVIAGRRIAAQTILASSVGAFLLTATLKRFFDRARPSAVPPLVAVSSDSFPSGHAALSAAVYLTIAALLAREAPNPATRRFVLGVGVFVALLVGTTRVFLGVHYPSDVLAGWVLGSMWALLCTAVDRRWRRKRGEALRED